MIGLLLVVGAVAFLFVFGPMILIVGAEIEKANRRRR